MFIIVEIFAWKKEKEKNFSTNESDEATLNATIFSSACIVSTRFL